MVDLVRNGELHDDGQIASTDERRVTSSKASPVRRVILLSVDRAKISDRVSFLANALLFLVMSTMLSAI
jgi:hypothetical protein